MATKADRVKARLPRGLTDRAPDDLRAAEKMMAEIRKVYELYGFEPVETPLIEYTDALGKFLPDQDRPNEGVFSFQDDDEQWLSLRYDLTAPLARFVAENFESIPKPYRSYRAGWVFRNEKPGPGRFRQFMQFDADTVGAPSVSADAEMCMMMADVMEALGIKRGDYVIRVNNRKVLDGVLDAIGLDGDENAGQRLNVLRAIDKLDKFGVEGVRELLGKGRLDESGDFTKGAGLNEAAIKQVLDFTSAGGTSGGETIANLQSVIAGNEKGTEGVAELATIEALCSAAGYEGRVKIDPSVVRGLEYYTGPVFEAELTFDVTNEKGEKRCLWLCWRRWTLRRPCFTLPRRACACNRNFDWRFPPDDGAEEPRQAGYVRQYRTGRHPGHGPGYDQPRPLPDDGFEPAAGGYPRRDVSRRFGHEATDEICRSPRRPLRCHSGLAGA